LFVIPEGASAINVIDLETRVTTRLPLTHFPTSMAISPDGKRLYVVMDKFVIEATVAVFELENLNLLRQFDIPVRPWDIVATDSGLVIVSADNDNPSSNISIFESFTGNQVGSSAPIPPRARLALHPSQSIVYAADRFQFNYHHFAFSPAGVITGQWQSTLSEQSEEAEFFVLPNGSRVLAGTGAFLTSTTDPQTDLQPDGSIGLSPITSAAFVTNQNLVVAVGAQQVRYYDYSADQLLDSRSVPEVRYVGVYRDRTAVLLGNPFGISPSEIRFLLPKPASAAENLPPTVLIQEYEDGTVVPVGAYLSMRAEGRDPDGDIQTLRMFSGINQVHFVGGDVLYGSVQIHPGTNEIYAVAHDSFGAAATSAVRRIFGNHLPQVQIAPMQTSYSGLQTVTIRANATDQDGEVKRVSLLVDNRLIGVDESAPYEFIFTPTGPGKYTVQVRAEDNQGGLGVSPDLSLTFQAPVDHFAPGMLLLTGTNLTLTGSTVNATRQKGQGGRI
jgi:hypothetical protein